MSSFIHLLDQRRLIGPGGTAIGGTIYFYYSNTAVLAPIYSDAAMTVPMTNPVVVGAGQIIPSIYLDSSVSYRRVIQYTDGTSDQEDPIGMLFSSNDIGIPVGTVLDFSGPNIPTGFLYCAGQEVSRSTYPDLFTAIGTTYGTGNGSTTFNLPDYRGRVTAGKDNMNGSTAGRLSFSVTGTSLGAYGGTDNVTLTSDQIPSHTHSVTDPGHSHSITHNLNSDNAGASLSGATIASSSTANTNTSTTGITIGNAGNDQAHTNTQPTIVVNKIIKALPSGALSLVNLLPGVFTNLSNPVIADGYDEAAVAQTRKGTEAVRVYSTNHNHIVVDNGTNVWSITSDSSTGDLKISPVSALYGAVDVGGGANVKILGKLVTQGASDSGGTGYRVLRVPN